jgi:hypothetical protein
MDSILVNWKTSLAGAVLIIIGVLGIVAGVHIPGFDMQPGAAIAAGIGLLMAKDAGAKSAP